MGVLSHQVLWDLQLCCSSESWLFMVLSGSGPVLGLFLSSSLKNNIGILMGIALWQDYFRPHDHFTILILSVKEQGSSSCCLVCCLGFLAMYWSFHCRKKFIPEYFVLGKANFCFCAFIVCIFEGRWLLYIDFCILHVYWKCLF